MQTSHFTWVEFSFPRLDTVRRKRQNKMCLAVGLQNMDLDKIDPEASTQCAMSSLCWCVENSDSDVLKLILSTHFKTHKITDFQRESLHILRRAVTKGNGDLLQLLLNHSDWDFLVSDSVDIRGRRRSIQKSLLGMAVDAGNRDITEMLLLLKDAMMNDSYRGKPLIHLALVKGHVELAKRLVDLGADVNITDMQNETPLFAAIRSSMTENEKVEAVRWLTERGADISHKSNSDKQPVHSAAAHSSACIASLSQAGCDVNAREATQGNTPLHIACSRSEMAAVSSLIRHGAQINCSNDLHQTPLHKLLEHACNPHDFHAKTRRSMAKVLISSGFSLSGHRKQRQRSGIDKVYQLYRTLVAAQTDKVKTLQHVCWLQVRAHLPGVFFEENLSSLELPKHLREYLRCAPNL